MRKVFYFAVVALSATGLLMACSDSTDLGSSSGTSGTSGGTSGTSGGTDSGVDAADAGPPAPPTLGTQIDRFGRPAANTALNHTFIGDSDATKTPAKDAYNQNSDPSTWKTAFAPEIQKNLAVYDELDGKCGNQAFASMTADANQYSALANVLADDRQYLNSASTTCTTYLGVELNATNAVPNTDCGGRKFTYDVINATYAVLIQGLETTPAPPTDGTTADPAKTGGTTFPYFAPATQ